MRLFRSETRRGRRPLSAAFLALLAGGALTACSPADQAGAADDAEASAPDPAADAMATAQEAPACRFTASGDELAGRASPPDSASVQLGQATVKLCYGAPSMRGREIMGGLVPYDQPWRMGANEPTTLHLPVAAEVGGVQLEPGSYALYAIPGESEWTIVLNGAPERWGVPINEEVRAEDVGSFVVEPESTDEPVEQMRIGIEPTEDGAARIALEWESTRVSFPIRPRAEG